MCLAVFDLRVSLDTKQKMVQALEKEVPETPPQAGTHARNNGKQRLCLEQLVTKNSGSLFSLLALDYSFLLQDPTSWETNQHYTMTRFIIGHVSVVNDQRKGPSSVPAKSGSRPPQEIF